MNIAWIDLETTRLDPHTGAVLEVGVIVTGPDLTTLRAEDWMVGPTLDDLARMDPDVVEMHRTSGLLADLESAAGDLPDISTVDLEAAAVLDRYSSGEIILAGSGVGHFESAWLPRHMPATAERLTYWTFDVGVLRRWLRTIDPDLVRPAPDKAHRALADARDHLAEWRWYTQMAREALTPLRIASARLNGTDPGPAGWRFGDRVEDGGQMGTIVRCEQCGGSGQLHDLDERPPYATPQQE